MKSLSIISSLERVPFVPVGLTELGTLTPQKMRELEELVSQLSKVWQVIEEPDFPWLGYRADKYNLEIRSELLTTLEDINEILRELATGNRRLLGAPRRFSTRNLCTHTMAS